MLTTLTRIVSTCPGGCRAGCAASRAANQTFTRSSRSSVDSGPPAWADPDTVAVAGSSAAFPNRRDPLALLGIRDRAPAGLDIFGHVRGIQR